MAITTSSAFWHNPERLPDVAEPAIHSCFRRRSSSNRSHPRDSISRCTSSEAPSRSGLHCSLRVKAHLRVPPSYLSHGSWQKHPRVRLWESSYRRCRSKSQKPPSTLISGPPRVCSSGNPSFPARRPGFVEFSTSRQLGE